MPNAFRVPSVGWISAVHPSSEANSLINWFS